MAGRHLVWTIVAIGVLVAGCATITGTATPSPTPTRLGIGPAPMVAHPLDPTPFVNAPCLTLKLQQINHSGYAKFGAGHVVPNADGPTCEWRDPGKQIVLRVTWLTTSDLTLADMYAHWTSYATWVPFTTGTYAGAWPYPGVYASKGNQDSDTYVAVNDRVLCRIHYDDPALAHPEGPNGSWEVFAYDVAGNLARIRPPI